MAGLLVGSALACAPASSGRIGAGVSLELPISVVTHRASFYGHTPLEGASGFVLTCGSEFVLATARHLIMPAGGVHPPIALGALERVLERWQFHPRTRPSEFGDATALRFDGHRQGNGDWLLLTTSDRDVVVPLQLRTTPVEVGEAIQLLGCPYADSSCQQNIYRGKVLGYDNERLFRYSLDPAVDLRGFSGSPILDADGLVVGIMSLWFPRIRVAGRDTVGGAESAMVLADICAPVTDVDSN